MSFILRCGRSPHATDRRVPGPLRMSARAGPSLAEGRALPKLSIGQKSARVLQFLYALGNPRIARAMKSVGFKKSDVDDGWTLLRDLDDVRCDAALRPVYASALTRLDRWENRWFPLASAAMKRRFPSVRAALFLIPSQADGLDVINTVGVFVDRLDNFATSADPDTKSALELLRARDIDEQRLGEARALLEELGTATTALPALTADDQEALARREAELWAWYLEWSSLARSVVTDRRLLRSIDFLRPAKTGGEEVGDDDEDEDAAPTPGLGPAPAPVG